MMDRGKYAELIDEETWSFIDETLACYPPDAEASSIDEQREIYRAVCQKFYAGRPAGVITHDYAITVPDSIEPLLMREYQLQNTQPKDTQVTDTQAANTQAADTQTAAQVLYFHGGGFVLGDLDSHDDVCAEICAQTGCLMTSVDYRLAPEHIYPAAFDDAFASFQHVVDRHNLPVILAGDSAGANLAASVAHRSRSLSTQAIGQLLIYPVLGGDYVQGTYLEHANAPMLSTRNMLFYQDMITGGALATLENPIFAPLKESDFSDLPPTLIFTAQCDPLAGDGLVYCEKIQAAGGVASCTEEAGLVHGYLRARHRVKKAEDSFQRIMASIAMIASS